jgi:very-short-patch-repair endonuclease
MSTGAIQRRLASGAWEPSQPGVYALAGTPCTDDQLLLAACLCAGPVVAVSHRAAASRWVVRSGSSTPAEISVDRERGLRIRDVKVHRSRDLHPDHIVFRDGLPLTTPARTLVDLGQVAPWYAVRDLLEALIPRGLITPVVARAALELHSRRGRRGCGSLRRVLDQRALLDRPTDSVLEATFAELCTAADLPRPVYQHAVEAAGDRYIDFAYPDLMIAIEVDGFEHHATRAGFIDDRIRGNELALLGWTVLHFTWDQVIHQPSYVANVVRRALRQRS